MNYDYDEGQPVVSRGTAERNFVAPMPAPLARREPVTIDAVPHWLQTSRVIDIAAALEAQPATQERTSAVDRAKGLQLRLWPFLLLYGAAGLVVGIGVWLVAGTLPGAALLAVLTFAALGVGTYIKLNVVDYDHSGAGVERLRIVEASDLAREEMHLAHELRKQALESFMRGIEGRER